MEPTILDKPVMKLVGILTTGKPDQLNYDDIWRNQFGSREAQIKPYSIDQAYYGAWTSDNQGQQAYLAGMAVQEIPAVPESCALVELPAAKYAIFPCSLSTISATYNEIYGQWLPNSPYEFAEGSSDYEYYPPEPATPAIYIPIKVKETQTV